MPTVQLNGKRILVTPADAFMGPALCRTWRACGAQVIASNDSLQSPDAPARAVEQAIAQAGQIDVLVANLAFPAPATLVTEVTDEEWRATFSALVDPLPRLARAILPAMMQRRAGKIVVIGSTAALRGMPRTSTYSAARGAQIAWVQAAGVEAAKHNVQINAVAQIFVENPTYFPPEVQANPKFQERLRREVPLGRLVTAEEDGQFVAYLCSDAADCFVAQIFPVCGGWVHR